METLLSALHASDYAFMSSHLENRVTELPRDTSPSEAAPPHLQEQGLGTTAPSEDPSERAGQSHAVRGEHKHSRPENPGSHPGSNLPHPT